MPKRGNKPRSLTPGDFIGKAAIYLPPEAQYDQLIAQPEGPGLAEAVVTAMQQIEKLNPTLKGVLPKEHRGFEPRLLADLLKTYNSDNLKKASGDVFGKIYEYFLNKFAQTGAQQGGEFFTPPSLVRLIVNIIEPDRGTVFDPAEIARIFEKLQALDKELDEEERRFVREGFDSEEQLAIFDLLRKDELKPGEIERIKRAAQELLPKLEERKVLAEYWQQRAASRTQVETAILDHFYEQLPEAAFDEDEVQLLSARVLGLLMRYPEEDGRRLH